MASTFQRTVSWWLPERCTVGFAPSVKTSPVVLQLAASAAQVATALYALLLRVPAEPEALVQVAALHVTSPADHVVEPPGAVNAAASACTDTFNCLVAVASTMFEMVTAAGDAMVDPVMSLTVNVTPDGKVTRAC